MNSNIFYSFLTILISSNHALACYPDPEFSYDDINSQDISIAIATVDTIEVDSSGTHSCWRASYSNAVYLYGFGGSEFSVATCTDEAVEDYDFAEEAAGLEYFGLEPNTEVLVGLFSLHEGVSDLRYAIPSCWGPLHYNLDKISATERTELLQELEDLVKDTQ